MHQATAPSSAPEVVSLIDDDNDGLQQMLAKKAMSKAMERLLNAQKRTRIAAEVDALMDNGVRIHPLCEQMYGGDRSGEAAPAPSAAQPVGSAGSAADRARLRVPSCCQRLGRAFDGVNSGPLGVRAAPCRAHELVNHGCSMTHGRACALGTGPGSARAGFRSVRVSERVSERFSSRV